MVEYVELPAMIVKVKDVFSINDMLKNMTEWFYENDYVGADGVKPIDNNLEEVYSHKVTQGGTWLDIWLWWRAYKYPVDTTSRTSYLRYRLLVDMHFLGDSAEVEVMHKGKKVKLNKGEMEVKITPVLELDYRSEWKKQGILKLFDVVFRRKMYKKEIDEHYMYILSEANKLQGVLKEYFKLEPSVPEEQVPLPPKGLL